MTARRSQIIAALGTVRDPELDEPVTDLDFVSSCAVSAAGDVVVRLRLPTYFCAPNFAFLMVADAYDAVSEVAGVRHVEVLLEDHFAADTINAGVAARSGFVQAFGELAADELGGLRTDFLRKAVLAGTDRVCRPLVAAGRTPEELRALTLGQVPASPDLDRLRDRRAEIGLPVDDAAPLLVDVVTGARVESAAVPLHLRRARLTGVNMEGNATICGGMLRHRYGLDEPAHPMQVELEEV